MSSYRLSGSVTPTDRRLLASPRCSRSANTFLGTRCYRSQDRRYSTQVRRARQLPVGTCRPYPHPEKIPACCHTTPASRHVAIRLRLALLQPARERPANDQHVILLCRSRKRVSRLRCPLQATVRVFCEPIRHVYLLAQI